MSRLYVSDLDGTLIGQDQLISDFALAELTRMLAAGLPFTVASARSAATMLETLRGLPLSLPMITQNGAVLFDPVTGRREVLARLDRSLAGELFELACRMGCPPLISCCDHRGDTLLYRRPDGANGGFEWYLADRRRARDGRLRRIEGPLDGLPGEVTVLSMIHRRQAIEPIRAMLAERYDGRILTHDYQNMYEPNWHWLTIHPPEATKGRAIGRLAGRLGLDPADMVVFGDHDNDLPMFELAGHSVAVGNAIEPVLRRADQRIGPNSADSVVRYIIERWDVKTA